LYDFYVEAPGLYAFRTLWYEGDGGANIEWAVIAPDGNRVLVNDTATNPQAIKAYQLPIAAVPAYIQFVTPVPGATSVLLPKTVELTLVDAGTQVSTTGVTFKLNGNAAPDRRQDQRRPRSFTTAA
jgi:hypothetical protein